MSEHEHPFTPDIARLVEILDVHRQEIQFDIRQFNIVHRRAGNHRCVGLFFRLLKHRGQTGKVLEHYGIKDLGTKDWKLADDRQGVPCMKVIA